MPASSLCGESQKHQSVRRRPTTRVNCPAVVANTLREMQDMGEDHLSDRDCAIDRHVGDHNLMLICRFQVDHIVAGRHHADVF